MVSFVSLWRQMIPVSVGTFCLLASRFHNPRRCCSFEYDWVGWLGYLGFALPALLLWLTARSRTAQVPLCRLSLTLSRGKVWMKDAGVQHESRGHKPWNGLSNNLDMSRWLRQSPLRRRNGIWALPCVRCLESSPLLTGRWMNLQKCLGNCHLN